MFNEIQTLSGHNFILDAAAANDGSNALCAEYCSPNNSFLSTLHTGHIWMNAPFSNLLSFLQHYLKCKQHAPDVTTACILIPSYLLKPLQSLLGDMQLLKQYHKGSELFTYTDQTGACKSMPGVHWPVYLYTDVPAEERDISVERTSLHDLHNASVLHDTLSTMPASDPTVLSTDNHLTMFFEDSTVQQRLKLRILMNTRHICTR